MFGMEFDAGCFLCGAMVLAGFSTATSPILSRKFLLKCVDLVKRVRDVEDVVPFYTVA